MQKGSHVAALLRFRVLLFDDLQDLHGASLDADTASNALGSGAFSRCDHNLHGADFHTLATGGAQLLIDHVHTGLGVLGDSASLAGLHALTALNADIRLCTAALGNNTDTG